MNFETWLKQKLNLRENAVTCEVVPADYISRHAWQVAVEECVEELRKLTNRKAFGLSEAEISVHYHGTLDKFIDMLQLKLRLPIGGNDKN